MDYVNILKEGLKEFSVDISRSQIDKLFKFKELLKEWNKKINLTAIEDDLDIIIKHFIDSASILPFIENKAANIIDIGTGAGFPGIPVKILLEDSSITLLDSLEKRVKFLNEAIAQLDLKNIRALHGRAEDIGKSEEYREKFDIAVARAVASLPVLLEYCLPFVKVGGLFIAMKGSNIDEINDSNKALDILGGEFEGVKEIVLPGSDIKRNLILVRKLRHTPTRYPRKAGKPSKEPLI